MDTPDALSSAAAGMRLQADRLDVIAQDLANASTVGYSRRGLAGDPFDAVLTAQVRQGALRRTGVPTDLALVGSGYFAVAAPEGHLSSNPVAIGQAVGQLDVSAAPARRETGNTVQETVRARRRRKPEPAIKQPIPEPDGRIIADGRVVDRLRLVMLPPGSTSENGPYTCALAGAVPARAHATVHSGYLEESTVDPIAEMTSLVATQRAYEANQKAAQRADESLRRAVTDVPAVRS